MTILHALCVTHRSSGEGDGFIIRPHSLRFAGHNALQPLTKSLRGKTYRLFMSVRKAIGDSGRVPWLRKGCRPAASAWVHAAFVLVSSSFLFRFHSSPSLFCLHKRGTIKCRFKHQTTAVLSPPNQDRQLWLTS